MYCKAFILINKNERDNVMVKEYTKGKAIQLSKNFKSTEFDCKCKYADCKKTLIELNGIVCLQKAREKVGKAIKITSGFRCKTHNKKVGGVSNSLHLKGSAFDLACPKGISLNDFAFICEQAGFNGVLRYDGQNFVHCDLRNGKYLGITADGGKTFKQVDTFNPKPTETVNMPLLKKGSDGDCVKVLQTLLYSKGFKGKNGKDLSADGKFGANTEFAVGELQKSYGLKQNNMVDAVVWQRLLGVEKWN